jgi:hypothetical protein
MRQRLRAGGAFDYQGVHRSDLVRDHVHRALLTAASIAYFVPDTLCDPACGDAHIINLAYRLRPFQMAYLSDISAQAIGVLEGPYPHTKGVVDISTALSEVPQVDLVVLTETLEHMDDPDSILRIARKHAKHLIASSPLIREPRIDDNSEHLWQWDDVGYREMLEQAGWNPEMVAVFSVLPPYYEFQLWGAT